MSSLRKKFTELCACGSVPAKSKIAVLPSRHRRQLDAVGPHAHAVVAEIVLELARLLGDEHLDDVLHGVVVALQHHVHRRYQHLVAETLGELDDSAAPRCCRPRRAR
jgi:uncharacterized protein YyaL (SSP411 family)